jgi:hypothetical protein
MPNKAPEPTTTAVTPRAFEWLKVLQRDIRARRAPAMVVAHLCFEPLFPSGDVQFVAHNFLPNVPSWLIFDVGQKTDTLVHSHTRQ